MWKTMKICTVVRLIFDLWWLKSEFIFYIRLNEVTLIITLLWPQEKCVTLASHTPQVRPTPDIPHCIPHCKVDRDKPQTHSYCSSGCLCRKVGNGRWKLFYPSFLMCDSSLCCENCTKPKKKRLKQSCSLAKRKRSHYKKWSSVTFYNSRRLQVVLD